ncbi:tetratricopeptide repeat protein [Methylopila henanensis]|uniref:Tetratricopeptide repeat protein n=1 Tax=Methylopila henanensis TaxID=873516 RepID=A0ABW4KC24_9HYPH
MKRLAAALAAAAIVCGGAQGQTRPNERDPKLPVPSFKDMMILTPDGAGDPTRHAAPPPPKAPGPEAAAAVDPNADLPYGAYQRGHYIEARSQALKLAEGARLNSAAMTLLGELYAKGQGVRRDMPQAMAWYERAADLGDPQAMLALGLIHVNGDGVPKNVARAIEEFERAGELGQPAALYNLGLLRLQAGDARAAAKAFAKAAEIGEPDAQYAYAVLLREGRGVPADPAAAASWLAKAAAQDQIAAMVEYAIALFRGVDVEKNELEAARLFRRAADRGNAIGQNRLARLYAYGRGVGRDPVRAAAWHRLASDQGLVDTWLEGFVQTLPEAQRTEAAALARSWATPFGPIPEAEAAGARTMAAPKP